MNKYTQVYSPEFVPTYAPLPLDVIGKSIDAIESQHQQGVTGEGQYAELRQNALEKIQNLPDIARSKAMERLNQEEQSINEIAQRDGYRNLMPTIRSKAAAFSRDFQPYVADSQMISSAREHYKEKKAPIHVQSLLLNEMLEGYEGPKDGSPGLKSFTQINEWVNRQDVMHEFTKGFKSNTEAEQYLSQDPQGRTLQRMVREGVYESEIQAAGVLRLTRDPIIREQMEIELRAQKIDPYAYVEIRGRGADMALGAIAKKHESNGNPGMISTGKGDKGGKSYGSYQFASAIDSLAKFLASREAAPFISGLDGLTIASPEFDEAWKKIAAEQPRAFENAQHAYIARTHFEPVSKIYQDSLDINNVGLREFVFSASIQHSPAGNQQILDKAKELLPNFDNKSPEEQLVALYEARYEYAQPHSPENDLAPRYRQELQEALRAASSVVSITELEKFAAEETGAVKIRDSYEKISYETRINPQWSERVKRASENFTHPVTMEVSMLHSSGFPNSMEYLTAIAGATEAIEILQEDREELVTHARETGINRNRDIRDLDERIGEAQRQIATHEETMAIYREKVGIDKDEQDRLDAIVKQAYEEANYIHQRPVYSMPAPGFVNMDDNADLGPPLDYATWLRGPNAHSVMQKESPRYAQMQKLMAEDAKLKVTDVAIITAPSKSFNESMDNLFTTFILPSMGKDAPAGRDGVARSTQWIKWIDTDKQNNEVDAEDAGEIASGKSAGIYVDPQTSQMMMGFAVFDKDARPLGLVGTPMAGNLDMNMIENAEPYIREMNFAAQVNAARAAQKGTIVVGAASGKPEKIEILTGVRASSGYAFEAITPTVSGNREQIRFNSVASLVSWLMQIDTSLNTQNDRRPTS